MLASITPRDTWEGHIRKLEEFAGVDQIYPELETGAGGALEKERLGFKGVYFWVNSCFLFSLFVRLVGEINKKNRQSEEVL